ncbi:ABC-2 family transporter protein [Pectobacterium brasiliense]|uniref:ABC-2 family transporter protein n=1 Tax=Pectobacterium brasiliense TaxID=180957 RepID=UPI000A7CCF2E|nr:ABC-2 family transporter protein [Pectobacterium brasiliense]
MLSLKNLTNRLLVAHYYAKNGLLTIVNDRAMFFTDFVMGTLSPFIVQLILWRAIFSEERDSINGFSFNDMIYYYIFALIFSRLNNGYDLIRSLSEKIREGELEVYLTKPLNYAMQKLFTFFGESLLYTTPLLFACFFKNFPSTENSFDFFNLMTSFMMIVFVVVISQLLCFLLSFGLSLLSFWVIEYNILLSFSILSSALLGGVLLPPTFWPDWLVPLMQFNPYRFTISAPAEFLTTYNETVFHHFIFGSLFYITLLLMLIYILWNKGLKVYNGAGG